MLFRNLVAAAIIGFAASIIPPAAFGQITIVNSPFLYKSPENYNDGFVYGSVNDTAHNRVIPVKIRFPLGATGQLPLILWSPGGSTDDNGREQNETWGRTLARAGYIVIHMSHVAGQSGETQALCVEFAVETVADCQNFPFLSVWRARDGNAVLAALGLLEQAHPEIGGRIDRNNIAVGGWSYGSFTAMALAGARFKFSNTFNDVSFANPLPKVFLAFSPEGPGLFGYKQDSWREIFRPVLLATGPGDDGGAESAPNRLFVFPALPRGKKYQLYINHPETIHATFNLENEDHPEFSQWLASYSLAYFDAYLKNSLSGQTYLISNRLPINGSRKTVVISRK